MHLAKQSLTVCGDAWLPGKAAPGSSEEIILSIEGDLCTVSRAPPAQGTGRLRQGKGPGRDTRPPLTPAAPSAGAAKGLC